MSTRSTKLVTFVLTVTVLAAIPVQAQGSHAFESGNDIYRVVINDEMVIGGRWTAGFPAAFTGASHPITTLLSRPGEVLVLHRECVACGGWNDYHLAGLRSWSTHSDYLLGTNPQYVAAADPGFDCIDVNALTPPVLEIIADPDAPGIRATWRFGEGDDAFEVERTLRAHGHDWIDASVESTMVVRNMGMADRRVGLREGVATRVSNTAAINMAYIPYHVLTMPPDRIAEPIENLEEEWDAPAFRMWLQSMTPTPSIGNLYFVGGVIAPVSGLEPRPTPPSLLQHVSMNAWPVPGTPTIGAADQCFEWHPPFPRREATVALYQTAMVSYWGHDEASALTLAPGEEARFTQYLVAFEVYPITAVAGDDVEVGCSASDIAIPLAGEARLVEPTAGEIYYRWSCADPRVSFDDPTSAVTTAHIPGLGAFTLTFTTTVGVFQSSDDLVVTAQDVDPPSLELVATPASLWPPNHRLHRVTISALVADECDPAPTLRLVSVTSNEPDDTRRGGDGHTELDIVDAQIGADDDTVFLRAERQGRGRGRIYSLVYEAVDASGNVVRRSVEVAVAHDSGRPTSRRRP